MLQKPMDVLERFPIRKSRKQKREFRAEIQNYLEGMGYPVKEEAGSFGCRNLVIGNSVNAEYLVTAHYDTCARLPFPNLITPCNLLLYILYQLLIVIILFGAMFSFGVILSLITKNVPLSVWGGYLFLWILLDLMLFGPANKHNANDNTSGVVTLLELAVSIPAQARDKVCFVLFDLEEAGLIGSASYRSKHKKETDAQIVLNLDCVGEGNEILLFPTGKLRKDQSKLSKLRYCCGKFGRKTIFLKEKGIGIYPSDQANFPLGVGICALRRSKWAGLYLGRIHTGRDTILEEENVKAIRDRLIYLIAEPAD